jgi:tetraacyldisaccharide 4'-kinase
MRTPAFWQSRFPAALLLPLSVVFGSVSAMRRLLFRSGILAAERIPVPVVVVGNLSAGGAGKTPTVRYLCDEMRQRGWQVGIVSRGYGGDVEDVAEVDPAGSASRYGDEPVLLARSTGRPVFVGRDRALASRTLLQAHPQINLIITDDGLQHYRLARDIEIVVIDGARGLENGWLLPAGPLREARSRLARADAVLINGAALADIPAHPNRFAMQLAPQDAWRLNRPSDARIAAVAGIARPVRFFETLRQAGLTFTEHAFPDHHAYTVNDLALPQHDIVLTTEKDAVKLAALQHNGSIWVIPVAAMVEPNLADWLHTQLNTLRTPYGRKTA